MHASCPLFKVETSQSLKILFFGYLCHCGSQRSFRRGSLLERMPPHQPQMHSCPKTLFVLDFAKNTSHPNLGSASPFILCRFCRLKKVFDPDEMLRPAHFCGKGKKFKSIIATLLVTINDHDSTNTPFIVFPVSVQHVRMIPQQVISEATKFLRYNLQEQQQQSLSYRHEDAIFCFGLSQ